MIRTTLPREYLDLAAHSSRAFGEENDCTVKMVALVCNVSYDVAHAEMKRQGRKDRRGAYSYQYLAAIRNLGKKTVKVDPRSIIEKFPGVHKTLRNVTSHHPRRFKDAWDSKKVYLMRTQGHVLAVINGEVKDWSINKSLRVREIYEVI